MLLSSLTGAVPAAWVLLSVSALRALILSHGLTHDDCIDKEDLRRRGIDAKKLVDTHVAGALAELMRPANLDGCVVFHVCCPPISRSDTLRPSATISPRASTSDLRSRDHE